MLKLKRAKWYWLLLIIISLFVVFSHLYIEISLIIKLYILPQMDASDELKYHESLGLFGPVFYLFEGGIKILEGLAPLVQFIEELVLAINSLLLFLSIVITYFVFKYRVWAAVIIVLLSIMPLAICLDL
jgi:hypothetical protein